MRLKNSMMIGAMLVLLSVLPVQASTILQFDQLAFNTPFSFTENGADTATSLFANTAINVTFDPTVCLISTCGGATNGVYQLVVNASSLGPATVVGSAVSEAFGGTVSITNGSINLLTVNFTDLVEGSLGGSSPTLEASQPPDFFSGTSNILDPNKLGVPRGFALSFSNLNDGGLGVVGTSLRSGSADGTGTFSATPIPEPATMLLFGTGLLGVVRTVRRRRKEAQMPNTKVTVVRVDNGEPFIVDAQMLPNADGSVSFQLPDGKYAGQDPAKYGVRADGDATQQYQRAKVEGTTVTFTPHPDYPAYVYLLGQGQVYPA